MPAGRAGRALNQREHSGTLNPAFRDTIFCRACFRKSMAQGEVCRFTAPCAKELSVTRCAARAQARRLESTDCRCATIDLTCLQNRALAGPDHALDIARTKSSVFQRLLPCSRRA